MVSSSCCCGFLSGQRTCHVLWANSCSSCCPTAVSPARRPSDARECLRFVPSCITVGDVGDAILALQCHLPKQNPGNPHMQSQSQTLRVPPWCHEQRNLRWQPERQSSCRATVTRNSSFLRLSLRDPGSRPGPAQCWCSDHEH